ncbi:MAG TPA: lactate utilization protein C, partial [Rummeliibacillus sp.]|nr:lactate utilization protein C [Rummeliibacillus sp.]
MIQHREEFLETIGMSLGRAVNTTDKPKRNWKYAPQKKGYQGLSQDHLLEILEKQCQNIHTDVVKTTVEELPQALEQVV